MKSFLQYIKEAEEKEQMPNEISTERGEIKFTIWKNLKDKAKWVWNNKDYHKINYVYDNEKDGIKIEFLLGVKDNIWHLWIGKYGCVSYSDDSYCSLDCVDFKKAIIAALDKVEKFINAVKENPQDYTRFYKL